MIIAGVGSRWAFVPLGVLVALFGLASYAAIRTQDQRCLLLIDEVAFLRAVPFLAVLLPYEAERLAQRAESVAVAPDEVVIHQGEPGDSYYVIASGELSVTVDGVLRDHRLRGGHGFGEIALLSAGPRTATVTATRESRLLRIRAEDFLTTVLPNDAGAQLARGIAEDRRRADLIHARRRTNG